MAHSIDKYDESMAVWPSGNGIRRINEVTLHPTQLVLTWATGGGYAVLECKANSVSCPQPDGKWVLVKRQRQCSVAGKVAVGLASHLSCVSGIYLSTGSTASDKETNASAWHP